MALTSVSVYELSRLGATYPQGPVRRRSNSTKCRKKGDELASFCTGNGRRFGRQIKLWLGNCQKIFSNPFFLFLFRRNNQEISITYMGRPRTPSEGDAVSSSTTVNTSNGTMSRRRPSPAVKKTSPSSMTSSSPAKKSPARAQSAAPVKKQNSTSSSVTSTSSTTSSAQFGVWGQCIETVNRIGQTAKKENKSKFFGEYYYIQSILPDIRRLKMLTGRRTMNEVAPEVSSDEHLVMTASRILSRNNEWTLNTCHAYLPTLVDNIISIDNSMRDAALEGLAAIASTFSERLTKFANANLHRIGVDVAAEERAEKAKVCIQVNSFGSRHENLI